MGRPDAAGAGALDLELSDRVVREIEQRQATALGKSRYDEFARTLRAVVDSLTRGRD
jgi:hypothetical protein